MAELTDELKTINDGRGIIQPAEHANGLATALGALSKGIDAFSNVSSRMSATKAESARLAAQNNEKAATTAAISTAVDLNQAIQAQPLAAGVSLNPNASAEDFHVALNESMDAGKKIAKYQTASEQGAMPGISVAANIDKSYQTLVAKYGPTAGAAILSGFEAAGVKGYLVQGLKDSLTQHDSNLKASQKADDDAFAVGKVMTAGGEGLSRADIIAQGYSKQQRDAQLQSEVQVIDLKTKAANLNDTQRKAIDTETQDAFEQHGTGDFHNYIASIGPQVEKLALLAQAAGPDAQNSFLAMQSKIDIELNNQVNQRVNQYVAIGGKDAEKMRARFTAEIKPLQELYKGDATIVAANQAALRNLQAVSGLDAARTAPLFAKMKANGIALTAIPAIMDTINSDPVLGEAFRREAKNLNTSDPRGPIAQIALHNIMSIVNGNKALSDLPQQDAIKTIPALYAVAKDQAIAVNKGTGSVDNFVNATGAIISATRSLSGVSRVGPNYTAAAGIVTAPARAAMIKILNDPKTHEEGQNLIEGSRAAAAVILGNMRKQANADYGYYKADFNKQTGQWEAKFDQAAWDKTSAPRGTGVHRSEGGWSQSVVAPTKPTAPLELNHLVDTANRTLEHLILTTQYDANAPKGTPIELRRWYSSDSPPASMLKAQGKNKTATDPNLAYAQSELALRKQLEGSPDVLKPVGALDPSLPFDQAAPAIRKAETGKSEGDYNAVVYGKKSPQPITTMSIGDVYKYQKSELRPQTKGTRGDGDIGSTGVGAYQFESETLRSGAEEVFGEKWRDVPMTKENQDKIAKAIHAHAQTAGSLRTTWAAYSG